MTLQPRPRNPIEQRKLEVRRHARRGVISVAAGVGGGLALGALSGSLVTLLTTLIFFSALGVLLGYFEYRKIQEIINHKDNY
ncbi:hypothetical protein [Corynebacterium matruchotii]|uniref:hypothetical protein n=1 Tax=Corynebacterium matruchotii TaxID=43768 RepID=UPI0020454032|nr:hypothetical protein [Corynebacterium matruchotii]DAK32315.1 MAG TPA: hypothetical protein [Caudoviricetes sp.]